MSSLELNKVAGAILVGGMVALISGILADHLVEPRPLETQAVIIAGAEETGEAAPAEAEAAGPEPVIPLLASADPAAGEKIAKRCAACHTFDKGGTAKIGPNLWNVVGGPKAHAESFNYSDAIAGMEGNWTYEDLNAFLTSPREFAPGTKMTFAGLSDVQDRADVIAWLRTLSDDPQPLPKPTAAAEPAPGEEAAPAGEAEKAAEGEAAQQAAAPDGSSPGGGSVAALLADADPKAGEKIAKRCGACHTFEQGGPAKIGPNLWNVVGGPTAHAKDYSYSDAIAGLGGQWTYEHLDAFLTSPRKYAPGTKMTFAGLRDAEDRADLIAWLRTLSENPQPLP